MEQRQNNATKTISTVMILTLLGKVKDVKAEPGVELSDAVKNAAVDAAQAGQSTFEADGQSYMLTKGKAKSWNLGTVGEAAEDVKKISGQISYIFNVIFSLISKPGRSKTKTDIICSARMITLARIPRLMLRRASFFRLVLTMRSKGFSSIMGFRISRI